MDLGTLGGSNSVAVGINASGQVVGYSTTAATGGAVSHAFLYSAGAMLDLGSLGGTTSSASGLNASGQVVGYSTTAADGSVSHAFLYSANTMVDLGTPDAPAGTATGINAAGQITGSFTTTAGVTHAFLYSQGSTTDLGTLGGATSVGNAINASGQIVGNSTTSGSFLHAFLYSAGKISDLGTLGGIFSVANGINAAGQVVGSSTTTPSGSPATAHAFLYSAATGMIDLGTLGGASSAANGVNGSGQVVGYGYTLAKIAHAMLYSNGTMTDLNSLLPANSGWVLQNATAINDSGQITGSGLINGQLHAFLLNTVTVAQSQTITFGPLSGVILGVSPFPLMATASSGLPVTVTSATPSVCVVSSSTMIIVAAGVCSVTATQGGDATFSAATPVSQSFIVSAASQSITFVQPADAAARAFPMQVTISATASSGLPVSFASTTAPVCTVSGNTVTIASAGTCSITASQAGNTNFSAANPVTQRFTVTAVASGPKITQNGIGPVFSSSTTIQPGSWISIYGSNLAATTATWNGDFPTSLGNVTVTVNGKKAYLWYVSPGQINLQAPDDTTQGTVNVTLTNASGSVTSAVTLGPFAPSFSLLDSKHVTGIIIRSDGSGAYGGGSYDIAGPDGTSLGYKTVAAKPGDVVELFGVGFGPTTPPGPAGQIFSGAAPTTTAVALTIGGIAVTPSFAGLSSAGLYQINLTIPMGIGAGDKPLVAAVGGVQTQPGVVMSISE